MLFGKHPTNYDLEIGWSHSLASSAKKDYDVCCNCCSSFTGYSLSVLVFMCSCVMHGRTEQSGQHSSKDGHELLQNIDSVCTGSQDSTAVKMDSVCTGRHSRASLHNLQIEWPSKSWVFWVHAITPAIVSAHLFSITVITIHVNKYKQMKADFIFVLYFHNFGINK